MASLSNSGAAATKCPVCGTTYIDSDHYIEAECGGEGNCPARKAGQKPSEVAYLCACNKRWLGHNIVSTTHSYNHCTGS